MPPVPGSAADRLGLPSDQRGLDLAQILAQLQADVENPISSVSDGNHFTISADFVEEGIPYYRGQDVVGDFFIEQTAPNFITQAAYDRYVIPEVN